MLAGMSAAEFVEWQERALLKQSIRDCVRQGMSVETAAAMVYAVTDPDVST